MSLERFFKNTGNQIRNGFKKTFNKGFGQQIGRGLSTGFGAVGNAIGKVSSIGDKVFNIPILGDALKVALPEVFLGNKLLGGVGNASRSLSNATNVDNYRGQSGSRLAGNILEKASRVVQDGRGLNFMK